MKMQNLEEIDLTNLNIQGNVEYSDLQSLVQSESIVILHFLRHLGCTFCQEAVLKLKTFLEKNPSFPKITFVHQGTVQRGQEFFDKMLPGAQFISDEDRKIFERFGILKMKTASFFNPSFWAQIFRQKLQGLGTGLHPKDDVLLLSGTFLFFNGKLTWVHRAQIAGDEPVWSKLNLNKK